MRFMRVVALWRNRMMSNRIASRLLAGIALWLLIPLSFADVPTVAQRCVGCHNTDGVTDHPQIPTLAGLGQFYLEEQLAIFSAKARPCVVEALEDDIDKCTVIGALTDAQKVRLAEFFDSLPYRPFEQEFDPELARRGEAIHAERCNRCHTDAGRSPRFDAAILAGQPIPYLVRQLEYFRAGERWQPKTMASKTEDLDPEQIEALAHFFARSGLAQPFD